ncbi:hypothetical protein [Pseudosporangium ferrugineum]|uniref:Uncharacterized protein n=1 Tax=Pseudosporangium ferrugineum TaxID=439699 RepID=A0A2T0RNZ5_9ACTN|nr:hypothetical protein [Pseudosporangium ferrugineum]PRY22840.1 hypothetical protein CLV70_116100 [Pseudosporangium ferrugineum]
MQKLSPETLTAIGRMTVAATDLEHLLAWIGAERAGGDAAAVFGRPGEPLRAARGSAQSAAPARRGELIAHVEGAATHLAQGQAALRAMWREGTRRDPALFDEITDRLTRCRANLAELVAAETVVR